jgi:Uma2 family endonuclease
MTIELAERKRIFPLDIEFPNNLPSDDGVPMETPWHRRLMNLLIDSIEWHWNDRKDYYVGGNMFIYFSRRQLRNEDYRGPDFFVVKDVERGCDHDRKYWAVWDEDGRYPDMIVELMSISTAETDLTIKRELYEKTFHTGNYVCVDPDAGRLLGWRLGNSHYEEMKSNERGWLWCDRLDLWIGMWHGRIGDLVADWPRFFTRDGQLVLTQAEAEAKRAEAEANRAEAQAKRADDEARKAEKERERAAGAEAELAQVRRELELLRQGSISPKPE